jgi:hypothetical protein
MRALATDASASPLSELVWPQNPTPFNPPQALDRAEQALIDT